MGHDPSLRSISSGFFYGWETHLDYFLLMLDFAAKHVSLPGVELPNMIILANKYHGELLFSGNIWTYIYISCYIYIYIHIYK